jgi:hypothetical protein
MIDHGWKEMTEDVIKSWQREGFRETMADDLVRAIKDRRPADFGGFFEWLADQYLDIAAGLVAHPDAEPNEQMAALDFFRHAAAAYAASYNDAAIDEKIREQRCE